jgi:hypothetical protein
MGSYQNNGVDSVVGRLSTAFNVACQRGAVSAYRVFCRSFAVTSLYDKARPRGSSRLRLVDEAHSSCDVRALVTRVTSTPEYFARASTGSQQTCQSVACHGNARLHQFTTNMGEGQSIQLCCWSKLMLYIQQR